MTMLDELEKLAREASGCAFTACGCRDCKAWAYAMNPATGLLLLAAVRAAEARPWIDTNGICRGCNFAESLSRYEGEKFRPARHGDGCRFAPLDSALAALKGST